jgi:hypothetical protein
MTTKPFLKTPFGVFLFWGDNLQFTGDKPQPRRAGDRAAVTKNKRLPSLGKGEGNFGV